MTTHSFASFPMAVGHDLHLELGRTRAIILALLISLCIALFASAAAALYHSTPASVAQPAVELAARQPSKIASAEAVTLAAPSDVRPEVEAVATSLAKRYRVSTAATRGLVATAYREGLRTGVDPLLIIAVIAVESRFNPIAESEMGAQGLMQVIPRYHKDRLEATGIDSVLDPQSNIRLGAHVLGEYIRSGGTEVAGLQRYNGATGDASNAYAARVLGEKQRLQQAVERARPRA